MVHWFLWKPLGSDWKVVPYLGTDFGTLDTSFTKFGTSFTKFGTSFTKFGIFLKKLVHLILELPGPLSYYLWSVYSFRDFWKVIGGCSLLRNKLWNPRYILKKIWYIQSSSYWDIYLCSYGPFVLLGTLRKWLIVISHIGMDFQVLGIFLRKFGTSLIKFATSNSRATRTPISLTMVHLFLFGPSGSDWRSFFASKIDFRALGKSLKKLGHS